MKAKKHMIQAFNEQSKFGVSSMRKALGLNRSSFYTTSQLSTRSVELEKSILMKSDDNHTLWLPQDLRLDPRHSYRAKIRYR